MLPSVIILSFKERLTKLGQVLTFITGKERTVNPCEWKIRLGTSLLTLFQIILCTSVYTSNNAVFLKAVFVGAELLKLNTNYW